MRRSISSNIPSFFFSGSHRSHWQAKNLAGSASLSAPTLIFSKTIIDYRTTSRHTPGQYIMMIIGKKSKRNIPLTMPPFYGGQETQSNLLTSSSPRKAKLGKHWERWKDLALNSWLYEIIAIMLSIMCLVAMIAILWAYDNTPQPEFPRGITLNTITSVLATSCKAALLFVVGETIGQLKWVWYNKENRKPLRDVQLFDSASRGPWGSLNIIWSHKAKSLVSLGALVTVLAFAFDPFVQQIISYHTVQTASNHRGIATIKRAKSFEPDDESPSMFSATYNGIWGSNFDVRTTCPSGNCTWPIFDSVGVCSKCEVAKSNVTVNCDLSSTINEEYVDPPKCNVGLPQGRRSNTNVSPLSGSSGYLGGLIPKLIVWTVDDLETTDEIGSPRYLGIDLPLVVVAETYLDVHKMQNGTVDLKQPFEATNTTVCALSLCLKTYNISVSGGKVFMDTLSPDNLGTTERNGTSFRWSPNPQSRSQEHSMNTTEFSFNFHTLDPGLEVLNGQVDEIIEWNKQTERMSILGSGPSRSGSIVRVQNTSVAEVMFNVADSLTKLSFDLGNDVVDGTVWVPQVYVHIRWCWLVLPILFLVAGIIFSISAILVNKGQRLPLWKSSILAAFLHGDVRDDTDHDDDDSFSRMEQVATDTQVRLQFSDHKGRLLLANHE